MVCALLAGVNALNGLLSFLLDGEKIWAMENGGVNALNGLLSFLRKEELL